MLHFRIKKSTDHNPKNCLFCCSENRAQTDPVPPGERHRAALQAQELHGVVGEVPGGAERVHVPPQGGQDLREGHPVPQHLV